MDGRATDTDKRSARERDTWYPDCPVTDWPMQRVSNTIGFTSRWITIPQSVLGILQFYSTSTECLAVPDEVFDELWRRPEAAERRVIIPVQFLFDLPAGKGRKDSDRLR